VLGGGLSNIPFLYDEGKSLVYKNVFSDLTDTPILKNKLGTNGGPTLVNGDVFGRAV